MKKYICLLSVISLISCKNTKYEISGILPNADDSSYVYLKTLNADKTYQILDSSLVIDNQYKIIGNWENEPTNAILVNKHIPFSPKFILENGKIILNVEDIITQEYSLSGTKSNDTLNELNYKILPNSNKIISSLINANNPEISIVERNKIYNEAFDIQKNIDATTLKTIKKNINEPIGALLLEEIILRKAIHADTLKGLVNSLKDGNNYKTRLETFLKGDIISNDLGKKIVFKDLNDSEQQNLTDYDALLLNQNIVYFWNNASENYKDILDTLIKIKSTSNNQVNVYAVYLGNREKNWELTLGDYKNNLNNVYSNIMNNKTVKGLDLKSLPKFYILNSEGIIENVLSNNNSFKQFANDNYLKSN